MSAKHGPPSVRPWVWVSLGLALLPALAPWPVAQGLVHGFLLAGLLPLLPDVLWAGLFALAAGWLAEFPLRLIAHGGGTAWADLTLLLLVRLADRIRPPDSRPVYVARVASILVLQGLLIHGALTLANGPHALGWTWFWTPLSAFAWGPRMWPFHQNHLRR